MHVLDGKAEGDELVNKPRNVEQGVILADGYEVVVF